MKLYGRATSGNCHKILLFAALTGIELTLVPVDTVACEQKTEAFTRLNPFQHIPALEDGTVTVWDSQAILIYLARKFDLTHWWPEDAPSQAHIASWLSISVNEIWYGFACARAARKGKAGIDIDATLAIARDILPKLDTHLAKHDWFATGRPTIADCALFPYIAVSHEGGIDLTAYPALRAWLNRVMALSGFIALEGMPDRY